MPTPLFNRIVIVGPGLIGGSLGLAVRARGLAGRVTGVGRRRESLDLAQTLGAIDEGCLRAEDAAPEADLLLLATGVGCIAAQAGALVSRMKPGAILTDVGSVKGTICRAVEQALSARADAGVRFVGGHPLAGSEQRGIAAARADLFDGALCILTPTPQTDPDGRALNAVRALWEGVGCRVREMPPPQHDELLAQCSHLPHLAAAALVNAISDDALETAARGFLDTTRVASGDPALWVDICLANREPLLGALGALGAEVRGLAAALDARDGEALLRLLQRAKARRDARAASAGRLRCGENREG